MSLHEKVDGLVLQWGIMILLEKMIWIVKERVQFIGQGVEGWMANILGWVKSLWRARMS